MVTISDYSAQPSSIRYNYDNQNTQQKQVIDLLIIRFIDLFGFQSNECWQQLIPINFWAYEEGRLWRRETLYLQPCSPLLIFLFRITAFIEPLSTWALEIHSQKWTQPKRVWPQETKLVTDPVFFSTRFEVPYPVEKSLWTFKDNGFKIFTNSSLTIERMTEGPEGLSAERPALSFHPREMTSIWTVCKGAL